MREHSAAERELQRASTLLLDIPSNSNHHHHHHYYMLNSGVRSRIRICDYLGVHEVLALYQMDRRVSGRLAHLRSLLTEGLSRFLLDLEQYQLSEFLCRFVLQPGMSSTTASTAASSNSVLSHPSSNQPPAAVDMPLSTTRSKYSRITGGYRSVAVVPTSCSYPGHHHRINTTTIISIIRSTTIIQPISA